MPYKRVKVVPKSVAARTSAKGAAAQKPKKKTPWAGLTVKKPKNFGIGNDIQPKRDLRRFMKWPKYIVLQRKARILSKRIKVPAPIAQFTRTADKSLSLAVFKLLEKHKLPTDKEKKQELEKLATDKSATKKPRALRPGVKEVVKCVEKKKAKLVVIAHDVMPIEVVLTLPGLCRKMDIPYVIVKGKAKLGTYIHRKNASCIAVTGATTNELKPILEGIKSRSDDWNVQGGGILSKKTQIKLAKREKAIRALKGERL
ncbi:large ribosomal subunit protein eL8-like [Convolutriloba macropyga]|uniref:large ribosomal subunit protein eL8-like n=1 Tax=Convolutriloba macropyga TaxID=536237 RepID=UPI003F524B7A